MKISKTKLRRIIKEEIDSISYEDVLDTTQHRYDVGGPEHKLLQALMMRGVLDRLTPEERAKLSGGDPEVEKLIDDLLSRRMLDSPGF